MPWSPDNSTTGGAITGFTSPTFTLVDDVPLVANARQKTVSAISTQGTATANSISRPYTATFYKPATLARLPAPNPLTGARGSIPNNQYKLVIRKGGEAAAGVPCQAVVRVTIDVPAGMDSYAPDDVKSMVSFLVGLLNEECNDLADTLITGIVS